MPAAHAKQGTKHNQNNTTQANRTNQPNKKRHMQWAEWKRWNSETSEAPSVVELPQEATPWRKRGLPGASCHGSPFAFPRSAMSLSRLPWMDSVRTRGRIFSPLGRIPSRMNSYHTWMEWRSSSSQKSHWLAWMLPLRRYAVSLRPFYASCPCPVWSIFSTWCLPKWYLDGNQVQDKHVLAWCATFSAFKMMPETEAKALCLFVSPSDCNSYLMRVFATQLCTGSTMKSCFSVTLPMLDLWIPKLFVPPRLWNIIARTFSLACALVKLRWFRSQWMVSIWRQFGFWWTTNFPPPKEEVIPPPEIVKTTHERCGPFSLCRLEPNVSHKVCS